MNLSPTIFVGSDTLTRFDKSEVDRVVRDLAFATRGLGAVVELGGQVGAARTLNVRVVDGRRRHVSGQFLVRVWVGPTLGGVPGGTQTLTVTKGTLMQTLVAGQVLDVMTDASAMAAIDVEGAAGTRGCHVVVMGPVYGMDGAWT